MSIRGILYGVFFTLVVLLAGLVWMSYAAVRAQGRVADTERRRFTSWKLADELRQSSDELTRMVRTFVVTGDPAFEAYFKEILEIRSGKAPRPVGYDGIYWDLVVATGEFGDRSASPVPLEELMRDMQFTEDEFAKLSEARRRSDALVRLEEAAMNAVKGRFEDDAGVTVEREPDFELARSLVHGEAYHEAKADIMRPIKELFTMLDARTAAEVEAARISAERYGRATIGLAAVTVVVALLALLLLQRRAIAPIGAMIARLRDIAEGEGDLTQRVDERRRDELGTLGRWFNAFVQVAHDIVSRLAQTSGTVASSAAEIAATSRAQEGTVGEFSASTSQIAAAARQISAAGNALAATMKEVSTVSNESAAIADAGRAGLREIEPMLEILEDSSRSVSSRLAALDERATGINGIVTTIVKVADQTDVLSVNAAIEAEKAGAAGAGFRVVAREIRNLADQTAAATLGIEQDVKAMQAAIVEGVGEMNRLGEHVRHVVERTGTVSDQLGRIIEQVKVLTGRFEDVNRGMVEQAQGTEQINDAMTSLTAHADRARSSLGEFTRAADHLREATVALEKDVGRFKLASGR